MNNYRIIRIPFNNSTFIPSLSSSASWGSLSILANAAGLSNIIARRSLKQARRPKAWPTSRNATYRILYQPRIIQSSVVALKYVLVRYHCRVFDSRYFEDEQWLSLIGQKLNLEGGSIYPRPRYLIHIDGAYSPVNVIPRVWHLNQSDLYECEAEKFSFFLRGTLS